MTGTMKRVGNLFDEICSVDNLLSAYYKAQRGKRLSVYVISYSQNLFCNIVNLRNRLLAGNAEIGRYRYFNIYDPKLRRICAAAFEERVMHHAIMNVCHTYFDRNLIYDTYATRLGKGQYAAIGRAQMSMRRYACVAKLDVRHYFDSISHDILKSKLRRIFKDSRLLALFDRIIDSYESYYGYGLPIGNLTSQYFANFYLSCLDHYIKETLKVHGYVRYMDDMLLFGKTPEQIREYVRQVSLFVENELRLKLKQPVFCHTSSGVSFLGYSLYPNKILLNRRSKLRFRKKMYEYVANYENDVWSEKEYIEHIIPLLAFAGKAYTKSLRSSLCADTNS